MAPSQISAGADQYRNEIDVEAVEREGPAFMTGAEKLAERFGEKVETVKMARRRAFLMAQDGASKEEIETKLNQSLSLQGAVITVIVAGATAYAGLNVMASIDDTMSLSSGDAFYNSSQSLQDGISDFFTNLPTVFVVIALAHVPGLRGIALLLSDSRSEAELKEMTSP